MLCAVGWYVVTDVSGQPISPIFKCQAVQKEFLGLLDPGIYDQYVVQKHR
jgi:hypothetical protein